MVAFGEQDKEESSRVLDWIKSIVIGEPPANVDQKILLLCDPYCQRHVEWLGVDRIMTSSRICAGSRHFDYDRY